MLKAGKEISDIRKKWRRTDVEDYWSIPVVPGPPAAHRWPIAAENASCPAPGGVHTAVIRAPSIGVGIGLAVASVASVSGAPVSAQAGGGTQSRTPRRPARQNISVPRNRHDGAWSTWDREGTCKMTGPIECCSLLIHHFGGDGGWSDTPTDGWPLPNLRRQARARETEMRLACQSVEKPIGIIRHDDIMIRCHQWWKIGHGHGTSARRTAGADVRRGRRWRRAGLGAPRAALNLHFVSSRR